jgi:hypothetical protein
VTNSQQIKKQEQNLNSGATIESNQSSGGQVTPIVITQQQSAKADLHPKTF